MLDLEELKRGFQNIDFREKRVGLYKVLVPFFHEDGDMYDIFVEETSDKSQLRVSDHGLTLMRLSYSFDVNTEKKKDILESIILQNHTQMDDGMIYLDVAPHQFQPAISKLAIIKREVQRSMFPEMLCAFVRERLKIFDIAENFAPTDDDQLIVDFKIAAPRPIFLYGVSENLKASKTLISCLRFKEQGIPFRSMVVHENMDQLSPFYRAQLTNVVQKQFFSLDGFYAQGLQYIKDELSA